MPHPLLPTRLLQREILIDLLVQFHCRSVIRNGIHISPWRQSSWVDGDIPVFFIEAVLDPRAFFSGLDYQFDLSPLNNQRPFAFLHQLDERGRLVFFLLIEFFGERDPFLLWFLSRRRVISGCEESHLRWWSQNGGSVWQLHSNEYNKSY